MTIETQLILGIGAFGTLSLALSFLTLLIFRGQRKTVEEGAGHIEHLEETLAETRLLLEESRQTMTNHTRRIEWLDAKIRQRSLVFAGSDDGFQNSEPQSDLGENRSRVMNLAGHGNDPQKIASSLGLMAGEVELILNLSNHRTPAI